MRIADQEQIDCMRSTIGECNRRSDSSYAIKSEAATEDIFEQSKCLNVVEPQKPASRGDPSPCRNANGIDSELKMRRVDWRWAVAKGFFNKETNQWNEELGGKEGYFRQRNERILDRFTPPTTNSWSILNHLCNVIHFQFFLFQ